MLALRVWLSLMMLGSAKEGVAQTPVPIDLFKPETGDGLRLGGGLVLYPSAVAELTYDSNVYNAQVREREDGLASFRPDLRLATDLDRHSLELRGSGEIRRYFKTEDENSDQYQLSGRGRFDLGERLEVVPEVAYARRIELRGTAGDQFQTDAPVSFHEKRAALRIARSGARLDAAIEGSVVRSNFSDASFGGVEIDLSARDVTIREARFRTGLGLSDRTRLFAEVGGNEVAYRRRTPLNRDSSGYSVLAGIHVQVTQLINLDAAVGFIRQDFDDPAFKAVSGVNYKLDVVWTPSRTWQIEAGAQRRVDASPREDAPAIVQSGFRLKAVRVLGDRWKVEADTTYVEENYNGIGRTDRRFAIQASVHNRLAERIGVFISVSYRNQDGGTFGRSYKGIAASAGTRVVL